MLNPRLPSTAHPAMPGSPKPGARVLLNHKYSTPVQDPSEVERCFHGPAQHPVSHTRHT
ncbi:hypothetical protein C8Q70DRAFT_190675 [Cubamyces menziesii]|nr:hypothetical protein C8Q70DRAFT_190675 [Cubamyces menziesii]